MDVDTSRRWRYLEPPPVDGDPPVVVELSEKEIIKEYFGYWSGEMRRIGKLELITHQHCIDDWVVVHWAELVK